MGALKSVLVQYQAQVRAEAHEVRPVLARILSEAQALRMLVSRGRSLATCGRGCIVEARDRYVHGSVSFAVKLGLV